MEQRGAFAADPDREKYACITGRSGAFFDRLEAFSSGRFDRKEAEGLPLYEVLEYMAAAFSLWGCGQDAYIAAFLDMAADFVKNNTASCVAFLEHWNVKKAVAGIPGGEKNSAVTLMTIHKSKGLEAPVVIVPFANWKIKESEEVWVDIEQPDDPKNALYGLPVALVPLSGVKKTGLDQVYADYQSQIALDNLNMLYVALTRASEQLHVITSLDVSGSTVVEYFNRFFSSLEGEIFDDDDPDGVYTYSKGKRSGSQSVAPHRQGFEIPDMTGCPWRERLRVNLDWKKSWSVPRARAVERGNMIHRVLSDVADVHGVDAAVTRSLAAGWFSCEQAEDIRRSVRAVVEHPVLSPYFQSPWQGEPERELMTSQGKVLRPDRVCVDGMRAAVIDYKTGAPRDEHVLQVRLYAKVLSDMGYRVENALLAYLDGETIDIVEC